MIKRIEIIPSEAGIEIVMDYGDRQERGAVQSLDELHEILEQVLGATEDAEDTLEAKREILLAKLANEQAAEQATAEQAAQLA